jgi:hypothetical protein
VIVRHYKIPISYPITFYHVKTDVEFNSNYLIDQIEENIDIKLSFNTNVKGGMTDWKFFMKDDYFPNILKNVLEKDNIKLDSKLSLQDAWGIKMEPGQETILHNHSECQTSGILYLNDCNNKIIFPQIETEILIEKNTFLIFSGVLDHFTTKVTGENTKYAIAFNLKQVKVWE